MKNAAKTLGAAFGRYRWHIAALAVLGVISALLEGIGINAVIPIMSSFMGGAGAGAPTDFITNTMRSLFALVGVPFTFRYLIAFVFCLFVARAVFVVAFGYIRGWINADFLGKESEAMLHKALLSSWPFLLKQKIGTLHNSLIRDVQQTSGLLNAIAQVIQSASGFLMYLLVAVNISPTMTFYTMGGGAILLLSLLPFLRRTKHIGTDTAKVEKQFSQFLDEHIIGVKTIKAAGAERAAIKSGDAHINEIRRLSIRQALVNTLGSSFFQPAAIVVVVLLFLLTYRSPGFSIISFAASLYLIQKIFTYLESGQKSFQHISGFLPYAENLAAFKRQFDTHREPAGGDAPFVFEKELAFSNVAFSYAEGERVLDGIDLTIRAGETVGLIGPSGAGKTSVADLLLRLFTPSGGAITLDGAPSESISLDEWRRHIGYVSQEVFLLNASLEDNIRFYNPHVSKEDVERAARQANIYDFIMSLPEGFQTSTGDRGVMLSGGQRQRISLARALAGNPRLLILDEATSALDHESEKLIHESIRALRGTMTVLVIAHRPSAVADADRIIVLSRGRVAEEGAPQELLQDHESYFYKMQQA